MLRTTAGQVLINNTLPAELRDYTRKIDKKGVGQLFQTIAERYPEKYPEIAKKLAEVGQDVAYRTGGFSYGLDDLELPTEAKNKREELRAKARQILHNNKLSPAAKNELLIKYLSDQANPFEDLIYKGLLAKKNPLAMQVAGASRGNPGNLRSILGGDLLYVDHRNRHIPVPVLHGYAEGVTPVEYWAGTFGTRKGIVDLKAGTQDAGYLGKQLNRAAHRLIITAHNKAQEEPHDHLRGVPIETDDPDNEGALLAQAIGGYKRNTTLTPKILAELSANGHDRILIRSPITSSPPNGGVYARDVGMRDRGGLSPVGDYVGMAAAQALSEPVAQSQISSKHLGGVAGAGKSISGFKFINQLIQVPKTFQEGATHAQEDGKIGPIWNAPAGGKYVMVGSTRHYVHPGHNLKIKPGQEVEAGDILSEGIPNPAEIVRHKGIGDGRLHFAKALRDLYKASSLPAHRRNVELIAKGLVNHVRLSEELGSYSPDDIIPYDSIEQIYEPRDGFTIEEPRRAIGKYLEKPVLHHSIGTKVRKSMLDDFKRFGVNTVVVHPDPPPFEPEMIRGADNLQHDPDWMTRQMGSNLKKSLLTAAHHGDVSNEEGTSFVPALARAVDFGRVGLTKGWKPKEAK